MSDPIERFKAVFFEEGAEAIDAIENNLLSIDGGPVDPETINDIFRAAHSLKGGSATFGMTALTEFTHVMETLLDKVRSGSQSLSQPIVDCLFSSLDILRNLISHYQFSDAIDQSKMLAVRNELEALLGGGSAAPTPANANEQVAGHKQWQISFVPHANLMHTGNDPLKFIEELEELGSIEVICHYDKVPDISELNPLDLNLSWEIKLQAEKPVEAEQISDIFMWVEDECDLTLTPITHKTTDNTEATETRSTPAQSVSGTSSSAEVAKAAEPAAAQKGRKSQSIRVDLDKIDSLINLLGELVITQSMLSIFNDEEKYPQFERLSEGLSQLERHTRDLQDGVMRIRMLPISFCFSRFPRMVRDLGKQLNKSLRVDIIGESTEVDKTVIEELTDPLVHLVRNSVDHGIEPPDVRLAKGKPAEGTITLKAFHQVGNIIIEINDDGAGLNTEKIHAKAIKSGIIHENSQLSEQEINELIFAPGFSTAEQVTDLSGRGVGMDVVKRNIQSLGGTIEVRSQKDKGSSFHIRLPLTLAILDGQLVKVAGETYIIPLLSIIESIQLSDKDINKVGRRGVTFKWRGKFIPILDLAAVFSCPERQAGEQDKRLVVVVESDNQQYGIHVDELTSHQQVVVKSLEANYGKVSELSGATILGDGSVALIIDVSALSARIRVH